MAETRRSIFNRAKAPAAALVLGALIVSGADRRADGIHDSKQKKDSVTNMLQAGEYKTLKDVKLDSTLSTRDQPNVIAEILNYSVPTNDGIDSTETWDRASLVVSPNDKGTLKFYLIKANEESPVGLEGGAEAIELTDGQEGSIASIMFDGERYQSTGELLDQLQIADGANTPQVAPYATDENGRPFGM